MTNASTIAAIAAMFTAPPLISTAIVEPSASFSMNTIFAVLLALSTGLLLGSILGIQIARHNRSKDRRDAERLDFLQVAGYHLIASKSGKWCVMDDMKQVGPIANSAREAIDNATGASNG